MRPPIVNRDPGDEQPTLFPDPPRCRARGCEAGDRKNLCKHDADQAHGHEYKPRPASCIVSFQLGPDDDLIF